MFATFCLVFWVVWGFTSGVGVLLGIVCLASFGWPPVVCCCLGFCCCVCFGFAVGCAGADWCFVGVMVL